MAITFELLPAAAEEIIDRLDAIEKLLMKKPEPVQPSGYITRKKVCDILHVSLPTVHAWMKDGRIKPYHIGGRTLFREAEVMEAIKPVDYGLARKAKGGVR